MYLRRFARIINFILCIVLVVFTICPTVSFAEEKETVRVGYVNIQDINGIEGEEAPKSGYYYEYLQLVASATGWDYEYVYGSKEELYKMLEDGEIDILPGISEADADISKVHLPTQAMGFENFYMYGKSDGQYSACNTSLIVGAKVGCIKDSVAEKCFGEWNKRNNNICISVEYTDAETMYNDLYSGKIDTVVDIESVIEYRNNLVPVLNVGKNSFYLAVNRNRKDLITSLNIALDEINTTNPYLIYNLQYKYFNDRTIGDNLSPEDKEYLKEKGTVRIAYEKNFLSFCGYDEETDECKGALKVFVDGMIENFGPDVITVELIPYDTVADSLAALENGEADVVFTIYQSYYAAEQSGLFLSNGITSTGMTAITQKSVSFNEFADNRVAVAKGFTDVVWYIEDKYPNWTIIEFDSFDDCVNAIEKGEADCIVESTYVYKNLIDYRTVKMVALSNRAELCFAVSRDDSTLVHIINHAISANNDAGFLSALSYYANVERKTTFTDLVKENVVLVGIIGLITVLTLSVLLIIVAVSQKRAKTARAELEVALEGAEAASRAKTVFLNNMSHDIRTPMNAIMGYTGLIEKNKDNPETVSDYLGKINLSGNYLLSVINNILDMARIESGKVELDENAVNLFEAETELFDIFDDEIKRKNLTFIHNVDVAHPNVICDFTKISQLIINILSNSIKYTPEGGNISVTVREIPCEKEGYATFDITFTDDGIGMSEEYVEHIFDSFSRERNTTQSKVVGTGLGMAICKKLVDLMGGTIKVKSEQGKGTTFNVRLTHRIADEIEVIANSEVTTIDDNTYLGKRILLAEDNELNYEIAKVILEDSGFEVEHASDGAVCIKMLMSRDAGYYDLILMDIQMPNMDGYKATSMIRKLEDEKKRNIPIIAVTANAFEEDVERAFAAGMNGHIAKPIKVAQLKSTLSQVLSEQ